MYEAERIMIKNVITVNPETYIYEAMNKLIEYKISGIPVVDQENNLVGIITEKDVIHLLMDENIFDDQTVGQYMTREVKTFNPLTSAVEMSEFFSRNPIRRVPIVEDGKLVGIVARRDIISLILSIRGKK